MVCEAIPMGTGQQEKMAVVPGDRPKSQTCPEIPTVPTGEFPRRMTPMERDVEILQCHAYLRSILEGTDLKILDEKEMSFDEWALKELGEEWVKENEKQKEEVLRQMKEDGENSDDWNDAFSTAASLGGLVLTAGKRGEVVMPPEEIEPEEVCEFMLDLAKRASNSWVERCGAGEGEAVGARAAIACMLTFPGHPEVARTGAAVLQKLSFNHGKNRDEILKMTVPMPPLERMIKDKAVGFSAIHAILANLTAPIKVPAGQKWIGSTLPDERMVIVQLAEALMEIASGEEFDKQKKALWADDGPESPEKDKIRELIDPALKVLEKSKKQKSEKALDAALAALTLLQKPKGFGFLG